MSRRIRKIQRKTFTKGNFKLTQTSRMLAEGYNFPDGKKKPATSWGYRLILLALIIIATIIYSPIFRIKNIIVNNVGPNITRQYIGSVMDAYLNENKFFILPQNNLLLFSPEAAKEELFQKIAVSNITFDRQLPNVLRMNVNERIIVGLWQAEGKLFTLDKRGMVVQEVDYGAEEPGLVIISAGESVPDLFSQVLDATTVTQLDGLIEAWTLTIKEQIVSVKIDRAKLPSVEVVARGGWRVFMSLYERADSQVAVLNELITTKLADSLDQVEYIEVRFGNKIYYKLK